MKIDKVLPGIVYLYSAEQTQKVNRCFCIRVMLCGIDSRTEEVRELGEEAVALFFFAIIRIGHFNTLLFKLLVNLFAY